jgi:hypothetical protein
MKTNFVLRRMAGREHEVLRCKQILATIVDASGRKHFWVDFRLETVSDRAATKRAGQLTCNASMISKFNLIGRALSDGDMTANNGSDMWCASKNGHAYRLMREKQEWTPKASHIARQYT